MLSDYMFNHGIDEMAHLISKNSNQPVFYYEYAHLAQFTFSQFLGLPADQARSLGDDDSACNMYSKKQNILIEFEF